MQYLTHSHLKSSLDTKGLIGRHQAQLCVDFVE
jgi:hypothetical protein